MSFDIVCDNCGAPSGPSVGVCPFCKTVLSSGPKSKASPTVTELNKLFGDGKLARALKLAKTAETQKPKLLQNTRFVLLYVKILIEVDGPSSKVRSLLAQALLEHPQDPALLEYMEVADARSKLSREANDLGEVELANLVRRSPKNVHALFLLGSHLYWVEKDTQRSLKYLEQCHRYRPKFLRAAACLAALYNELGLKAQAKRLFRHCASIEENQNMKNYFKSLAK